MKKIFTALLLLLFFVGSGIAQPTKLLDGFEKGKTLFPGSWTLISPTGTKAFALTNFVAGTNYAHSGKGYVSISCKKTNGIAAKRNNWLISPQITVESGSVFSFWARSQTNNDVTLLEDFNVNVSKAGTQEADFSITLKEVRSASSDWTKYTYVLGDAPASLQPGDKIYIAIQSIDLEVEGNSTLYVDDFYFGIPSPILTLSKVAWETTGYLGDVNSSSNTFSLSNTGEGSLSIASITGLDGTPFTTTLNSTEVNLEPFKSYAFSVDYACTTVGEQTANLVITTTDGQSATIALKGTTKAALAAVLSLEEGFEAGVPESWLVVDGNKNGATWKVSNSANAIVGTKSLIVEQTTVDQNEWLITPRLKVLKDQVFTLLLRQILNHPDILNIKISKTGRDIQHDFTIDVAKNFQYTSPDETQLSLLMSDIAGISEGDEIFIGVQVVSPGMAGGLLVGSLKIDNFKVYVPTLPSNEKYFFPCTVKGQVGFTVADHLAGNMAISMPGSTNLKSIAPNFILPAGSTIDPLTAQDFSKTAVTYTVTLQDGTKKSWDVIITKHVQFSNEKNIISCNVSGQVGNTIIDQDKHTVSIVMPFGADITVIVPQFVVSPQATIDLTTAQDFSSKAVAYTVTAEDKTTQVWSVSIACKAGSKEAEILTFKVNDKDAVIDAAKATATIELAAGADLTTVKPVISISPFSMVTPASDVTTDFSKGAVTYTVTSQDGTKKDWQVTVTKQVILSSEKKITSCSVDKQVGETVIDADNHTVAIVMPFGTNLTAIAPVFAISPQATIDPTAAQDFSTKVVTYTLTAEDKSTQVWTVSITCKAGSKEAEILTFVVGDKSAVVDATKATVTIELDADANLISVKPIFTISPLATVSPASDVATDFSKGAVTFTVTAQDGTKKDWQVTVTKIVIPALEGMLEGFEGGAALPENWKTIDVDGNGKSWTIIGNAKFEGKYGIKTSLNKAGNNDWLITPKVKVRSGDILSFMYRSASENTKESFNVNISKTGRDVADFGVTLSELKEATSEYGFTKYEYKLTDKDDIKVGDEIYIAIQVVSVNCMELHVDNISVAPAPVVPKAEVNKNHWRSVCKVDATQTSEKTFTLTNTLAGTLNVTNIILPEGFSTSIDKNVVAIASGESFVFNITFAPIKEGIHGGDLVVETNGGNVSLSLSGYGVAKAAYHESFETEASYAEWETLDNDGDGNNWFPYQNTDQAPDLAHSGSTCIVSESAILKGGPATPDNWLITPRLAVGAGQKMTFWVGAVSDISFKECYSVKISTTDKALSSFTTLVDKSILSTNGWSMVNVDLAAYAGKRVYIAVEHHNISNESQIIFDDFILPAIYEAATPDLNISVVRPENTQTPLAQADFKFKLKVGNKGAELKEKVAVNFKAGESNLLEIQDLDGPLAKGNEAFFTSKVAFQPTVVGNYSMSFEAVLANDDNQADNIIKLPVTVTDTTLAKDNGTFDNFIGLGKVMSGVIGQRFALNKKATITSISFFIVAPKEPIDISAGVYAFTNAPGDLLGESNSITVTQEGWYTVMLKTPLSLESGNFFIGLNEGLVQSLNLGVVKGIPANYNCFIGIDNKWIKAEELEKTLNITLMIRANFGKVGTNGIEETLGEDVSLYPNPARDYIVVRNGSNARVSVYSMTGVQCIALDNLTENGQIDISSLVKGIYFVKILFKNGQKPQVVKLFVE